jgi:Cu2+-containing amine oxidase
MFLISTPFFILGLFTMTNAMVDDDDLTTITEEQARNVREIIGKSQRHMRAATVDHLKDKRRFLVTMYRLPPAKDSREANPKVVVEHYLYDGATTVLTTVDTRSNEVINVEEKKHVSAALAPEEYKEALDLAKAQSNEVKAFLTRLGDRYRSYYLVPQVADPNSPKFEKRIAHVTFESLANPTDLVRVEVNLSDRTVKPF